MWLNFLAAAGMRRTITISIIQWEHLSANYISIIIMKEIESKKWMASKPRQALTLYYKLFRKLVHILAVFTTADICGEFAIAAIKGNLNDF